jgi:hypothetical protein
MCVSLSLSLHAHILVYNRCMVYVYIYVCVSAKIPGNEMKVGVAFSILEKMRENKGGFDYAISQPTLEQVFVFCDLYRTIGFFIFYFLFINSYVFGCLHIA